MSLVESVVDAIARQIAGGVWREGQKLPSVRAAAVDQGISKNTMAEAYDRLVARGLLVARQGSGYYVTGARPAPARPTRHVSEAIGIVSLLREQIDQQYGLRPGDGRPPPSWTEGSEIGRHLRGGRASRDDMGYGSSWGLGALRDWLRVSLAERSIETDADGVMLTHGVNHGLDLVIRHLLEPGDTVLVDSPGYYPLFGKLRLAKVTAVPVRRLADGPDLDDLATKAAAHGPKLFFTQSQAHNPTGGSLSPAAAFGLLQAADAHGFRIVEDDVFADLLPASLPRLAAFGLRARVIYVGSFSKTLSASLRCGYVAGAPEIVRSLVDIKMLTTVATSAHIERLVVDLVDSGQYRRHLRRLRARVEEAAKASVEALASAGLEVEIPKVPGFYLWAPLPTGTNEVGFCQAAAARDIFVAPGGVFRVEGDTGPPAMRVNIAYGADPQFVDFLKGELG